MHKQATAVVNEGNRLRRRLAAARDEKRGILLGFLPGGYPDPTTFTAASRAAFAAGLDALEVSLPGPAPELDGPVIQEAAATASIHFNDYREGLALAAASRSHPDDIVIALAYAHHLDEIGMVPLLDSLRDADIDGILTPQLSVAEQLANGKLARERGLEPVVFVHLEEDVATLRESDFDEPFLYLQSADLHTGATFNPDKAVERLRELHEGLGGKPYRVAVGFGVRGPAEVATVVTGGANGAIVGTRLVKAANESVDAVTDLIDDIRPALFHGYEEAHEARRVSGRGETGRENSARSTGQGEARDA